MAGRASASWQFLKISFLEKSGVLSILVARGSRLKGKESRFLSNVNGIFLK
jgi:hypothetical protein